jgi:hypothetical protein
MTMSRGPEEKVENVSRSCYEENGRLLT